ncbi:phage/plasmid primase, P4 family [Streptococcus agalactiae]|uniref:phage/plasmid primase, P4 family n=1 Tax=Streptococcus agalactiae TaxID=1311 RepID=UPI0039ECB001
MRTETWNGYTIRFVEHQGEWWAVAKDITNALGLKQPSRAISTLKGVTKSKTLTKGGEQELSIINEKDIYRLVFKSRKPEAEAFQEWVFETIKQLRQSIGLDAVVKFLESIPIEMEYKKGLNIVIQALNELKDSLKNQVLGVIDNQILFPNDKEDTKGKYTVIGKQLYNAETGLFEEITPEIIVTRKIKTGYNPNAKEPNLKGWKPTTWLKELFDHDEELYNLAIQIIKASITGQSLQKIFWLYGEGGTGKGTFQQLLINLIGMENVASLKITGLSNSRFSTSILLGKSLVIGDDVQKDAVIKDTSDMFSLATGDIMTIEDKGKRPYSIRLNMTVVQSSNGLPRMNGDKSAIDRRFRILIFSSRFKDKPNPAIKKDYINRKEVLEYLVKLAIETPSEDINPKQSQTLLGEHQKDINPVLDFVEKTFREDLASEFIPNDFIWYCWKQYQDYFNQSFFKTERGLHRDIKQVLPPYIRTGVRTIPSGQQLHKGFYPKEDTPDYASLATYSNGRETPEKRKRPKQDRGYWNSKAKHK